MPSPTLSDIALRAKVSTMTVSLALRNDPRVAKATRDRVQRLARTMNYRVNPLVSALMTSVRTRRRTSYRPIIGFVAHEQIIEYATFRQYLAGAQERAKELGFKVDLFPFAAGDRSEARVDSVLQARGIVGVLIAPLFEPGCTIGIQWNNYALAALGYSMPAPDLHRAVNHQHDSMSVALTRLDALGYRRPGLAMRLMDDKRVDHNWTAAYLSQRFHRGDRSHPPPLLTDTWEEDVVMNWHKEFRPDVIITHQAHISATGTLKGLQRWLQRAGIRVPADIGLAVVDREPTSGDVAGVDQNSFGVGACGIDLVVDQLNRNDRGAPAQPRITLVKGVWVDGATVQRQ